MNRNEKSRIELAAAIALTLLFAGFLAPDRAFATAPAQGYERGHHDEGRVTVEGRIRSIHRDRDGYRVELERDGRSFWVPERWVRSHSGEFRVGHPVRLGGLVRGGLITVDLVDWPPFRPLPGYREPAVVVLRGFVDRVEPRRDTLVLRQEGSGRLITVKLNRGDRRWNRTFDPDRFRRGDFVTLAGDWSPSGRFDVYRIESMRR
jgi:hypothetical protein